MVTEPEGLLVQLALILDVVGLDYAVGGSVASSLHGEYRATNDIDVVVDVGPTSIGPLVAALDEAFHVDRAVAVAAAQSGGTFTALHKQELIKVDFFVATEEKLFRLQLHRKQAVRPNPSGPPVHVISPEDTILAKLVWYRRSEGVLERQLRDVAGVLKAQGPALDLVYLTHAAAILGVRDLLRDALERAGLDPPPEGGELTR